MQAQEPVKKLLLERSEKLTQVTTVHSLKQKLEGKDVFVDMLSPIDLARILDKALNKLPRKWLGLWLESKSNWANYQLIIPWD